jgi:hypothetical protein
MKLDARMSMTGLLVAFGVRRIQDYGPTHLRFA